MTSPTDILSYLRQAGGDAADIAQVLGASAREVQNILHTLDDSGHVIMRNGLYRLSEAYKLGHIGEPE